MSETSAALIKTVRSGVVNLILERNGERIASATGFLIDGYLVTASHVLREGMFETLVIRFDEDSSTNGIKLDRDFVLGKIRSESDKGAHNFAVLEISEPEFEGHYRFKLGESENIQAGQQILFFEYPYDSPHLTSHVAYISAVFDEGTTRVLQLDGSVNPSNSGGPVIDVPSGRVIAIVTRAQTGLSGDFDDLIDAFSKNVAALENRTAIVQIGGIDPVHGLKVTMESMRRLALNMRRSANVGIGYANAIKHLSEALHGQA